MVFERYLDMTTVRSIVDIMYPNRCWCCDRLMAKNDPGFCALCEHTVIEQPHCCARCGAPIESSDQQTIPRCGPCQYKPNKALAYCWWAMEYGGAIQKAIQKMKFGRQWTLAVELAQLMQPHPQQQQLILEWDAVVPVPMHWRTRMVRGFNQSTMLARAIASRLHIPVLIGSLNKHRHTARQTTLSAKQRTTNLAGVFSINKPDTIAKKRLLLVDDVVTTGTTIQACARTLKAANARSVDAWSVCRKL